MERVLGAEVAMDAMAAVAANATVAAMAPTSHLFEQVLDNHKPRVEPPFGKDNPAEL